MRDYYKILFFILCVLRVLAVNELAKLNIYS